MKKMLIAVGIGIVIGAGGYWAFSHGPMASVSRKVEEQIQKMDVADLKKEMEKYGQAQAQKEGGASQTIDDRLLNNLIKAKIEADPSLKDASIKVSSKEGDVALAGTAGSYEEVARAMRLAMECEATWRVLSKIEVKKPQ